MWTLINSLLLFVGTLVVGFTTAQTALGEEAPTGSLKRIAVARDDGHERTVQFDLLGLERCMFGDLDLILLDFKHGGDRLRLQLTVESIGGTGGEVYYAAPLEKKTSKHNFGTFEVQLPISDEGKMYGVFLCSVAAEKWGKEPCSKQPIRSFDSMMSPYRLDSSSPQDGSKSGKPYSSPASVEPKNYYANVLVSTRSTLAILENSISPENESLLLKFGLSKDVTTSGLSTLNGFATTVASRPFEAANGRLQLPLPYFSRKKCGGV